MADKTKKEEGTDGDIEEVPNIPNMSLANLKFSFQFASTDTERDHIRHAMLESIRKDHMLPFYEECCVSLGWNKDETLVAELEKQNKAKLKQLQETLKDAEENLGEVEIRHAYNAIAVHYCTIGAKSQAETSFRVAYEKAISTGQKIDLVFYLIRLGLFAADNDLIKRNIEKAEILMEEGGDWDRRNRLKVYKGLYLLAIRDFKGAADLFLQTISTFTTTEIMTYQEFAGLTVLLSIVSLDRPRLKKEVVQGPEIQEQLHQLPVHKQLLMSLYNGAYADFFVALVAIDELIRQHRFFHTHAVHYVRELRILAYSQLLQSYRSVTMQSMGESFGVSVEFIDREVSRFVAAGRLNCKIDKVAGVIETTRPDEKNKQYQEVIKKGDLLLNRIQKLSQNVNI